MTDAPRDLLLATLRLRPNGDLFVSTLVDLFFTGKHTAWVREFMRIVNEPNPSIPFVIAVNMDAAVEHLEMGEWTTLSHILGFCGFVVESLDEEGWIHFVYVKDLDRALETGEPPDRRFYQM